MKRWQSRLLGLAGVLGGGIGLFLCVVQLLGQPAMMQTLLLAAFALLYALALWGGILAFENAPQAVALNRWLWFLQIPVISSPWLSYLFVSGAELIVRVRPQQWAFDLTWLFGSRFDFTWNRPRTLEIGINLLALAMFIWLSRLRRGGKR